jgi:phage baseplate assembly protein W
MAAVYKDLPLDLTIHPVTGDVRPVTDAVAVKRALKNLLLTQPGERPFNPKFGSDITSKLFNTIDVYNKRALEDQIYNTIIKFEPRVQVLKIEVDESQLEDNGLSVTIEYRLRNSTQIESLNTFISRVG